MTNLPQKNKFGGKNFMNKRILTSLFSLLLVLVMVTGMLIGCDEQREESVTEGPATETTGTEAPQPEENPILEEKERLYEEALELLACREDEAAYKLFKKLGDYRDSEDYLSRFYYMEVKTEGRYEYEDESENSSFTTYRLLNDKGLIYRIVRYSEDGHEYDEYTYDDFGNLVKDESVYDDGNRAVYEYLYDANNNVIKEICQYYSGNVTIYDYVLDKQGRTIKELRNRSSGESTVIFFTYDDNGNLIKTVREDSDETGYTEDYTYDERGNMLKRVTTYSDGATESFICTYDANNKLLTETYRNVWGEYNYQYSYDDQGRLIKVNYHDRNNNTSVTDYTYDEKGNLIKEVWVDDGKYWYSNECTYDDVGNVITEVYTSASDYKRITKSTYKLVYVPYDLSGPALNNNAAYVPTAS